MLAAGLVPDALSTDPSRAGPAGGTDASTDSTSERERGEIREAEIDVELSAVGLDLALVDQRGGGVQVEAAITTPPRGAKEKPPSGRLMPDRGAKPPTTTPGGDGPSHASEEAAPASKTAARLAAMVHNANSAIPSARASEQTPSISPPSTLGNLQAAGAWPWSSHSQATLWWNNKRPFKKET